MNITGYFQLRTAAINSAFAVPSRVSLHSTDMRGTMQQCPVPTDNMGIAFHQSLTPFLTGKGCFLGMLQLRAHSSHEPHSLHTEMLRNAEGRCSTSSQLLTGKESHGLVRNMFCAQNLGWKKSGKGQVRLTSFEVQPATPKLAWAPAGAGPTFRHHRGEKSARRACSPLLTLGERCIRRCYNLFPSELLELISFFKCLSFASQGGWIWELPHYICMFSYTHTSSLYGGNICCKHMEKALLEASI